MRFKLRVQDYRGADSVVMTDVQKQEQAATEAKPDGEVVVYAALPWIQLVHFELTMLQSQTICT